MIFWEKWINDFLSDINAGEAMRKACLTAFKHYVSNFKGVGDALEVAAWRQLLGEEGKSPYTIQLYAGCLRRYFAWLADNRHISGNPAARLRGAKLNDEYCRQALTEEQAAALLKSISGSDARAKRDRALIALLITTGIRTIEASRASVDDLRQLSNGSTVLYVQGKGRDGKDAYVKVEKNALASLRDWLQARKGEAQDSALFCGLSRRWKGRLSTNSIRRMVKARLREIGLDSPFLTAHSMRHTAATLALKHGATPEQAQQMLRHKNIATTLRYSHAIEREKNDAEARIEAAIFEGKK